MPLDKKLQKIDSLLKICTLNYNQLLSEKSNLLNMMENFTEQINELTQNLIIEHAKYAKYTNMYSILNNYETYVSNRKNELYNLILNINLEISKIEAKALDAYKEKMACQNLLDKTLEEKKVLDSKLEIKELDEIVSKLRYKGNL